MESGGKARATTCTHCSVIPRDYGPCTELIYLENDMNVPALTRDDLITLNTLCLARIATMALACPADHEYKRTLQAIADKLDAATRGQP